MKRLFACLAFALLLAACGNKGPLVMPEPAPAEVPAPAPAAAEPAPSPPGTPPR